MTKQELDNLIIENIYTNDAGLITGLVLQQVLLNMANFTDEQVTTILAQLHSHSNKQYLDLIQEKDINVLSKLSIVDGNLQIDGNAYSTGELSAYGLGPQGGGGGGTMVTWGDTVNNYSLLTVEGVSKNVALSGHKHAWSDLVDLPDTLSGYGITDVYTKTQVEQLLDGLGAGTVTSVGMTVPTGLTISGSPITTSGTLALGFQSGYSIPTTAKQNNWDAAYTNTHTHSNKTQIDLITQAHINVLNKLFIDADGNVYTTENFYSTKEVSAYGLGSGGGSGGAGALYELSDTSVASRVSGDILVYNGTHWENRPQSSIIPPLLALGETSSTAYRGDRGKIAYDHALTEHQTIINGTGFVKASGKTLSYDNSSYSLSTHNHNGIYEPVLGNPAVSGYLLSSTTAGARSWVAPYSLPTASSSVLGGVKIGTNVTISNGVISVHNPVTIGTANGLSLSTQTLSLALATTSANGALSATDKTYIELLKTFFEYDSANNAIKALKSFYSTGEVSAYGLGSGGGGGTGYERLDAWADYDSTKSGWVLSALLGVNLNTRLSNVESGSATSVTTTGTGNAITSITQSGSVITATKGSTFSLSTHNHDTIYKPIGYVPSWGEITGKPSTFAPSSHSHSWSSITSKPSSFTPSAHTIGSHSDVTITSIASGEILKWDGTKWINNTLAEAGISASTHSHSWSQITNKPSTFAPATHTHSNISITAGTGLSGGGTLSESRTLSIASTYAPNTSTSLGASQNLNNYQTAGFYHQTANANATTALNYPVASAGSLLVQTAAGVIQTYKVYNSSNVYVRGYYNSAWSAWRKLALVTDNVASATKLQTARNINGTSFDGTAAITTANWGTARNIGIVNSDGTGTAVTTSVNGSANVNLKLPATIKATLTGNASSATNLSRSVVAGNGLTGGGVLNADRTLTLGTPSSITLSSTNSVAASSHTHNLALGGTASQYLNGATALVTIPTITAGNGLSGGGQLTASRTLTLGTPSTLTNTTTNGVTGTSHTHAITTTTVGAADTIVATDASGGVRGNIIRIGSNWTLELSGTELWFKYGGVVKQKMFQDGSFVATGEVAAYSQGVAADELQLNKLTLLQGGGDSKYLTSSATQIYFSIGGVTPLVMSKTEVRRGTSDNNVNLGTSAYPWANIYGVNLIASTNLTTPKITLGNGWTIEQTSASLTIRRNGVVKGTFNA